MVMDVLELLEQLLRSGIHIQIDCTVSVVDSNPLPGSHVRCEACGWERDYASSDSAARGLRSHQQHCTVYAEQTYSESLQWIDAMHR